MPAQVEKYAEAILPFGLTLEGVRLNYATAQLFARIDDGDVINIFFFAVTGITAEYAFDPRTYAALSAGKIEESMALVRVTAEPGLDTLITITTHDGRTVRLFTLTRQQAENACKLPLAGQDRLADLRSNRLRRRWQADRFQHRGERGQPTNLSSTRRQADVFIGTCVQEHGGLFTRCTITVPQQSMQLRIERVDDLRVQVTVPPITAKDTTFFLVVDYVGDIANCFIDGKLVADQFYNGSSWKIGLKHLIEGETEAELQFLITPIRLQSGVSSFFPTGMAFRFDSVVQTTGIINSITSLTEYAFALQT